MAYDLKSTLETEVVDKLLVVMKAHDQDLEAKIAKLGSNVGSAATWAALPTVDHNGSAVDVGDVATLTSTDGTHPAGKYERLPDNSGWEDQPYINFDDIGATHTLELLKAAPSAVTVDDVANTISATVDDKFMTPKQVADVLTAVQAMNADIYHPKGGLETLKVLVADGDEGTKEAINASQLNATFTQAEINSKYDAL